MKHVLFLFGLVLIVGGLRSQTYYQGLQPIQWTNSKGKLVQYEASKEKWYHLNTVLIENDSIFMYKSPVKISRKDTMYSASDGAFYYYYGNIILKDSSETAFLVSHNCDYCGIRVRVDSLSGFQYPITRFDTLKIIQKGSRLKIGTVSYRKIDSKAHSEFPSKSFFYKDSNSIYRINPAGQYTLISRAIETFFQTKDLIVDNDTLRICVEKPADRFSHRKTETLNSDSLHIRIDHVVLSFMNENDLKSKAEKESRIVRYIQINEIVDYWRSARIQLIYKIVIPKSTKQFTGRQFSNLLFYNKSGNDYVLDGDLPQNNWELKQQE